MTKQWAGLQKKYHLTPRELQVCFLACQGLCNKEIAEKLEVSVNTAKVHLRNVYRKVRVNSKVLLLLKFLEDTNQAI